MFDNVALNVVIGLVFIYLLYSLFATVVSEIIATYMGLRARNLKEGVDRMLNDEEDNVGFWPRLKDSLKLMKNPDNPRINKFYANPEIKYLGSTGVFKNPSSFKSATFSRTLLYELNGTGPLNKETIRKELLHSVDPANNPSVHVEGVTGTYIPTLDKQSAQFVLSMFNNSYGDLAKFKLQLEAWFDRTMEQCTEWYKRKIQIVLLVLGFFIAWFFNADTFTIIGKLSTDKDARDKIVALAVAYSATNPPPSAPNPNLPKEKLDSLIQVKNQLQQDIENANTLLGSGGWLPDTVIVFFDPVKQQKIYTPLVDELSLPYQYQKTNSGKIGFTTTDKWSYFFNLIAHHFFGFLVTAIAISLGAPFWFDLLNKLMKLRTSVKQDTDSTDAAQAATVSPLNREA